jgi:hypothetical protein
MECSQAVPDPGAMGLGLALLTATAAAFVGLVVGGSAGATAGDSATKTGANRGPLACAVSITTALYAPAGVKTCVG